MGMRVNVTGPRMVKVSVKFKVRKTKIEIWVKEKFGH